jgi:hypothetical protein
LVACSLLRIKAVENQQPIRPATALLGFGPSKSCVNLTTRPLLPQHERAAIIQTNDVEGVLADIDPHYADHLSCCRKHGVLLVWVPLASLALTEEEHGRTIPLAD